MFSFVAPLNIVMFYYTLISQNMSMSPFVTITYYVQIFMLKIRFAHVANEMPSLSLQATPLLKNQKAYIFQIRKYTPYDLISFLN